MSATPEELQHAAAVRHQIATAHHGSKEALGQLLEGYRQYLLLVAQRHLDPDLQGKVGASDVVQDTFLEAYRDFGRFQGETEGEVMAWLRRLLLNNLANLSRQYRQTGKRQLGREVSLGDRAEKSSQLVDAAHPPDAQAIAWEEDQELQQALERLPEHYRQVIRWRHQEQRSFEEIGQALGRTAEAARKLWARAVEQLKQLF
jgi:RNA polymerase sigma-70 factor (ECF subfamily)